MEDTSHRKSAFFGRRKGHALRPAQSALFETLLPRLALDLDAGPDGLRSLFPVPHGAPRVESGSYLSASWMRFDTVLFER